MFDWLTPDAQRILWDGLVLTMVLTLITSVLSFVVGIIAGILRQSPKRCYRWLATAHIEIHRNVPALILLIFWAFSLPNIFQPDLREAIFFNNAFINWLTTWTGLLIPYYTLATIIALTLNTSAYIAELFRAGIRTIPTPQIEAARTLGATSPIRFRKIVVPQAIRAAFPAITTRLIHNMKNVALASIVSAPVFFQSIEKSITLSFRAIEFLLLAAVVYLILSAAITTLLNQINAIIQPKRPNKPTIQPTN